MRSIRVSPCGLRPYVLVVDTSLSVSTSAGKEDIAARVCGPWGFWPPQVLRYKIRTFNLGFWIGVSTFVLAGLAYLCSFGEPEAQG